MNTRDEMAGESVTEPHWSGFDQLRLTDDDNAVFVTVGSRERWDKSHLRRLRQSADLPGLVPVVDADAASDGKPYAVTPVVDTETLADRLPPSASEWADCAAITEAAARATHEAHLRGLFHGALSPDQIFVLGNDVAVAGVGLGLGGNPTEEYDHWVAPEVLEGADATERSDVYSLGKVLEASLGQSIDDVPRSVRRLIMWSSSDTPEARPPSALEFASILAEAMGEDRTTYSPAFIPTAEITDLASTASEAVAAHVESVQPSSSRAGTVAGGVAAAAGAGALAASLGGSDADEVLDGPDAGDLAADTDADLDLDDDAIDAEFEAASPSILEGADEAPEGDDIELDAATTADVASGSVDVPGSDTAEVSHDDIEAAVSGTGFDSRTYSDPVDTAEEEYDLPAAARTVDLDIPAEERRGNRAGILVGAILAAGLGLVAFQLLNSDDSDGAGQDDVAVAADNEEAEEADEADEADTDASAATDDGTETDDGAEDGDSAETDASAGTSEDESADEDGTDGGDGDGTDEGDSTDANAAAGTDEGDAEGDASAGTDDEDADEAEATTSTTEAPTTTTEAPTTTTEAPTTTTEAPTTTTEAPEADVATAAPATVDGPITADEAAIQILHGIPGVDADVYLNGEALAPGFTAGTIAGPADLDPGTYDVAVYAASDAPPVSASDRDDDPLIAETVTVGDDPATLVAHLDGDGNPALSAFPENLSTLAAGKSRIEVRHLAAAPAVQLNVDGEPTGGLLEPGQSTSLVLDAGDHTLEATTADGDPVQSATIAVADGELASISLIGSVDGGIEVAIQRYTGLGSAPASVPTGDSNLLGEGEDPTGLYFLAGLASLMAAAGGLLMMRRSRQAL